MCDISRPLHGLVHVEHLLLELRLARQKPVFPPQLFALKLQGFKLGKDLALVINIVDPLRREVPEGLVRPLSVVVVDILADLLASTALVLIAADDVYLFLLESLLKKLRDGFFTPIGVA